MKLKPRLIFTKAPITQVLSFLRVQPETGLAQADIDLRQQEH
jgi:hypothetical protein